DFRALRRLEGQVLHIDALQGELRPFVVLGGAVVRLFGHGGSSCLGVSERVQACSRASSLPARSRANRSSQPPTWVSPIQICGTEVRPALRVISARTAGWPSTLISRKATPLPLSNCLARMQ